MKNMIIVLSDGETWEMLGSAQILYLTDKGIARVEAGDKPKHLDTSDVMAVSLIGPDPELVDIGEPDNLHHMEHYVAKHLGIIPARWIKNKETGKLEPIDKDDKDV